MNNGRNPRGFRRRLGIAYLIAIFGAPGWFILSPRAMAWGGAMPSVATFIVAAALLVPLAWLGWMALLAFVDRPALLFALPGLPLAVSPLGVIGYLFGVYLLSGLAPPP